ncbi:FCD domain-containing protein [Pseudonocardia nematodicida]|uniref:FCD domain-containing protein n=1 Tax=Pseudonocardia nematodicida TaxID=1206997 RepID=A0ABV1KE03_9PSEU
MSEYEGFPPLAGPRSRAQEVADHLRNMISNRLAPGERLGTKSSVRASMGVSVSTMNEAVRLLEDSGIVSLRPGPKGGIFAATPSPRVRVGQLLVAVHDDPGRYAEAASVRDALEPLLVSDAARLRSPEDVGALRAQIAIMTRSQDRIERFLRADLALHERIAEISDRSLVSNIYLMVLHVQIEQLAATVASELPSPDHTRQRLRIHEELVQAIADGDADTAVAAMVHHAQPVAPVDSATANGSSEPDACDALRRPAPPPPAQTD